MPVVASSRRCRFEETDPGLWRFAGWGSRVVTAGITDRRLGLSDLLAHLRPSGVVEAEQVHGSSLAMVECVPREPIAGCDALLTGVPGVALVIRTADCLPIFFADSSRGIIGLAHVGWRGLARALVVRMVTAFRHAYHSRPEDLRVAIGPGIRACCYTVGPEFAERFGPFVEERDGRRTFDLADAAIAQLQAAGVRPARIADCQRCTACDPERWFSLRREGDGTGRLRSFIMVPP